MSVITRWMDRVLYPDHADNWDDTAFRGLILSELKPEMHVLDVGAGAGIVTQLNIHGRVARICGLDPDERVTTNPNLDEGRVGFAEKIPWEDESFDLAFSDNVLEHLENPEAVFKEVARVLKPGGRLLVKTTNKRHYMPVIARLTPHGFHKFYNSLRGRDPEDTFPTTYRVNTGEDMHRCARASGLEVTEVKLIEGRPEYLRLTAATYLAGFAFERVVNRFEVLAPYRIVLMATMAKA